MQKLIFGSLWMLHRFQLHATSTTVIDIADDMIEVTMLTCFPNRACS